MSTVTLPRWIVGLLVGVSALCVVAVAFLVGRATAPSRTAASTRVETASTASAAAARDATHAGPSEVAVDASLAAAPRPQLDPVPSVGAGAPTGSGPDAPAVAAYFRQMDAIAAEAKSSQDPQALARSVLDQTLSGNMGAIDGLIATERTLETRLGQIVPPPSCREHYQRSVLLFGRAIALLERTRGAMTGQGVSDIGGVAAEGRAIEEEARALDALANDLRRAAGLPPVS